MTASYGQLATGSWLATAIGAFLLLYPLTWIAIRVRRLLRRVEHRTRTRRAATQPPHRQAALAAEALAVKERIAGHIDTTTYQARMHDLTRPKTP